MSLATAELPADPVALRAFALACQGELKAAQTAVQLKALEIEKLRFQIAKLRRMQFGRSSGRITRQIEQLELQLEELETSEAEDVAWAEANEPDAPAPARAKPKRKPLPEHLPREEVLHQPAGDGACVCPACGGGMDKLGEDVTEVLDYVPSHFQRVDFGGAPTTRAADRLILLPLLRPPSAPVAAREIHAANLLKAIFAPRTLPWKRRPRLLAVPLRAKTHDSIRKSLK